MSGTIDARIKIKHDTTENWNNAHGFIFIYDNINFICCQN